MRLTDHTDYSLRVLMYLNRERRLVTLQELSEKLAVSKNNLIKVSNQLAKLKLIQTVRGRWGGLVIEKETGNRTIKEIVLQTENLPLVACFSSKKCDCPLMKGCLLEAGLRDALHAFLESLGQKTLNDVTPKV